MAGRRLDRHRVGVSRIDRTETPDQREKRLCQRAIEYGRNDQREDRRTNDAVNDRAFGADQERLTTDQRVQRDRNCANLRRRLRIDHQRELDRLALTEQQFGQPRRFARWPLDRGQRFTKIRRNHHFDHGLMREQSRGDLTRQRFIDHECGLCGGLADRRQQLLRRMPDLSAVIEIIFNNLRNSQQQANHANRSHHVACLTARNSLEKGDRSQMLVTPPWPTELFLHVHSAASLPPAMRLLAVTSRSCLCKCSYDVRIGRSKFVPKSDDQMPCRLQFAAKHAFRHT